MPTVSTVSYPGIPGIRALRFPFSRGVSPSIGTIYCLPFDGLDPEGPLRLGLDDGDTLEFPDCAVATAHIRQHRDRGWPIWAVHFLDRRWRWRFKRCWGDWNRRLSDGTVDEATQKTPGELAALLLAELGESGYDVSQMPSGVYPRCHWDAERTDLALQKLCDYVACEVILNPLTNRVEIWPLGVGSNTQVSGLLQPNYKFVPRAAAPSQITVTCGPSTWQTRLLLKAVARDAAGKVQLLANSDVAAASQDGLAYESPFSFGGISDTTLRTIAFADVWRLYAVAGQEDGTLDVPNCSIPVASIDQYVLNEHLLTTEEDLAGFRRNVPSYVHVGECWVWTELAANASNTRSFVAFKQLLDRRLVEFAVPLFKLSSSGTKQEPTLYLVTSYRVKRTDGVFAALFRFGSANGSGGNLSLHRPEIFSIYASENAPGQPTNTEDQAIAEADRYIALFQRKYAYPFASEATVAGLMPFSLDGILAQVSWEWSANEAPRTTIYENLELDASSLSSLEQKRNLLVESLAR